MWLQFSLNKVTILKVPFSNDVLGYKFRYIFRFEISFAIISYFLRFIDNI